MASLVGETGVHASGPSPEELEEQVNRVLSSDVLKASHNLHSLLKFMVAASSEGKLAKYYTGAGKNDPWIIQIPAGSYVPHFRPKQPAEGRQDRESRRAAGSVISWISLGILVGLGMGFLAFSGAGRFFARADRDPGAEPPPKVRSLWEPVLRDGAPGTTVVFWNQLFLSNEKVLLRYNGPITAPTGTGVIIGADRFRHVCLHVPV